MQKIKQLEISKITPNIKISDLCKLQDKFPDLNMLSYGVELYGSSKYDGATDNADKCAIKTLEELSSIKNKKSYKTAIHLNNNFANMFNKDCDFHESKIWKIIKETKTDKVVWNFYTLTEQQKTNFSIQNFWNFIKTKANPDTHTIYSKLKSESPNFYNSYFAYVKADYYIEIQPSVRDMLSRVLTVGYMNLLNLERVNGLYIMESLDKIPVSNHNTNNISKENLESWFVPKSWAGGINPNNIYLVLNALAKKLNCIGLIDVSVRSGVMTDGKTDIDKIEALMQKANEWQNEFNSKQR
ncbi:MAG: hypothetical protein GX944_00595 [Alphaproteobacteria bacterium]|nr:hypothetical protein [Alphaproteobacteria bacterium]